MTTGLVVGTQVLGQGLRGDSVPDNHPCLPHIPQLDAGPRGAKAAGPGPEAAPGEMGTGSSGPGTVLQFFTRLRRHASLDGASPYFKVKKWKLEPSQRASSLDTRGKAPQSDRERGGILMEALQMAGNCQGLRASRKAASCRWPVSPGQSVQPPCPRLCAPPWCTDSAVSTSGVPASLDRYSVLRPL